ncbi:MAG: hypothetical protein HPY65_07785 [Syntrophaceae bacterium]|nr:hypothetical protein [Syntrophaceae bacterium]
MTPLAAIRAQIKVILSSVTGIGIVHDYQRFAVDWQKMLDLFKDDDRINTCMFRREKMIKRRIILGNPSSQPHRIHIFKIICIRGLNDAQATAVSFDDDLAAVEEAFEGYKTLNGTCETINPGFGPTEGEEGVQISLVEERMFGNVLCHYAELRLSVQERNAR